jgi:RNA polymerase sigma-70 factor, ECF subfamily
LCEREKTEKEMKQQSVAQNYSEEALVARLKHGDAQAVREWFSQYKEEVQKVVTAKLASSADVEELVQQVFINALRQLPLFRGESSLKTWMFAIARHEVADFYRKKYAKKALQTLPLSELLLGVPVADAHEVSQKVQLVLGQMSDRSRELLLRKYVDGQRVVALAQDFSKSAKAIESELFRARTEFKMLWAEYDE